MIFVYVVSSRLQSIKYKHTYIGQPLQLSNISGDELIHLDSDQQPAGKENPDSDCNNCERFTFPAAYAPTVEHRVERNNRHVRLGS